MGIPTYTRWLCRKYPKILQNVPEEDNHRSQNGEMPDPRHPNPLGYEIDNFYIDMNGIIHDCSHGSDLDIIPSCEEDIFENITNYMDRLFTVVRPRQLLFLSIDGVAPWAKVNQQRTRRYKSSVEYTDIQQIEENLRHEMELEGFKLPSRRPIDWNSSFIAPCTPFMNRLSVYLDYYIHKRLTTSPAWSNIEVILSDSSVPGEGEHKIIDYIRRQRTQHNYSGNQTHVLHGLDADLSMLSLATHEPRCSVLVEQLFVNRCKLCGGADHTTANCLNQPRRSYGKLNKQQRFLNRKLQMININTLREYLDFEFEDIKYKLPFCYDLERIIDDYLCICMFVGNDFLPSLPTLEIKEGAITMLLNIYKRLLPTWDNYIVDHSMIGMTQIRDLLQELDPLEDVILSKRRYYYTHTPPPVSMTQKMNTSKSISVVDSVVASTANTISSSSTDDEEEEESVVNTLVSEMSRALGSVLPDTNILPSPISTQTSSSVNKKEASYLSSSAKSDMGVTTSISSNTETTNTNTHTNNKLFTLLHGNENKVITKPKMTASATSEKLVEQEYDMKLRQRIRQYFNNIEITDEIDMGTPGWRDRYYAQKFKFTSEDSAKQIDQACDNYIKSLQWIMKYYSTGCPDWTWSYSYHYAPSTRQLLNSVNRYINKTKTITFKENNPPPPLFALLSIQTPSSAAGILPPALSNLITSDSSPIASYYPKQFELDFNLHRYRWLAIPKIPVLDYDIIHNEYLKLYNTLTDEEKKINQVGDDYIYLNVKTPLGIAIKNRYPETLHANYNKYNITGTLTPTEQINNTIHYTDDNKFPPVSNNNAYKCSFMQPPFYPQFISQLLSNTFPLPSTLTLRDRVLQEPRNWIGINISHLGRLGMVKFNPIRHYHTYVKPQNTFKVYKTIRQIISHIHL